MKTKPTGLVIGLLIAGGSATAIAAAPQIIPTTALQHTAVDIGQTTTFTVTATGGGLSYQWRLEGHDLPSQTNQTLTFAPAQPSDEGDYTVEVRNSEGLVVSEPSRLWVVPPASDYLKRHFTNTAGLWMPYYTLIPTNYAAARRYPLVVMLHGAGNDSVMTGAGLYLDSTAMKVFSSYRQQATDPAIIVWPTRRAGDSSWTDEYLQLASDLLDTAISALSVDTNRVYVTGASEGVHGVWDLLGMRPGFFAGAFLASGGRQANSAAAVVKDVPMWFWCAADDPSRLAVTLQFVNALRQAGGNPIYTEYASGGHLGGIRAGYVNPVFVDWMLAQRRGMAGTNEPLLAITSPTCEAIHVTGATNLNLAGSAAALGQDVTRVAWENTANGRTGVASGSNAWSVTDIPLVPYRLNLILVTATTTSWAPAYGGNTTFNDTLSVFSSPIRATLAMQGQSAILSWTGGAGPFSVQRVSDLAASDWTTVVTNAVSPVSLPVEGQVGFFRVTGQ